MNYRNIEIEALEYSIQESKNHPHPSENMLFMDRVAVLRKQIGLTAKINVVFEIEGRFLYIYYKGNERSFSISMTVKKFMSANFQVLASSLITYFKRIQAI